MVGKILPGPLPSLHLLFHILHIYDPGISYPNGFKPTYRTCIGLFQGKTLVPILPGKTLLLVFASLGMMGAQGCCCRKGRREVELEAGNVSQEVCIPWMHDAPLSAAWSWGWDMKVGALQLKLMLPMPPWSGKPRELNLNLAFNFPDSGGTIWQGISFKVDRQNILYSTHISLVYNFKIYGHIVGGLPFVPHPWALPILKATDGNEFNLQTSIGMGVVSIPTINQLI